MTLVAGSNVFGDIEANVELPAQTSVESSELLGASFRSIR